MRNLHRGLLVGALVAALAAGVTGVALAATTTPAPQPAATVAPAAAIDACAKVAWKAGFSYTNTISTSAGPVRQIVLAVAIAMAESSCNPSAVFTNSNGCRDRGLWQIDDCAHPNVSDACAFQIQCNADAAWNISGQGANWGPWTTFGSGAWKTYLNSARDAIGSFTITLESQGNGTCLDASSGGTVIQQWACSGTDPFQQWTIVATNGQNPVLRNVGAGTCLTADSATAGNGGVIKQAACNSGSSLQRWWIRGSGALKTDGKALAGLEDSGVTRCLDASASSTGNGGKIIQWGCSATDTHQQWN